MTSRALSIAVQALQAAETTGLPWTAPLVNNTALGSFWVRLAVAIGTADTAIAIALPRRPSGYFVVRSNNGAAVFDGSNPAAWTGTSITLRASAATVVSIIVG